MSLAALVHLMCEKYGWSIEYVLNLTRPQITALTRGGSEIAKLRKETSDGRGQTYYDGKGRKVQVEKKSADDIFTLATLPGFKLTERAKKKLGEIAQRRAEKLRKKADASNTG